MKRECCVELLKSIESEVWSISETITSRRTNQCDESKCIFQHGESDAIREITHAIASHMENVREGIVGENTNNEA